MKRVLLIARFFPPVGGAGVQRSVKLVRYLPESGWEPTVITGGGDQVDRWTPQDRSLTGELSATTGVHRVKGAEPDAGPVWRARAERWGGVQSRWDTWWIDGVARAARDAPRADVVLATMSPFSSAAAAAAVASRRGVPWVADLRDPWALDEMTAYPTVLHRKLRQREMRRSLASAAAIVMNTDEAAAAVRNAFPELTPKVVDAIPNGYDPADFHTAPSARTSGALRIVHTGYLHTEIPAGRWRRALSLGDVTVDRGARSHVYLMAAIASLRGAAARPVELHLAGVLSDADRAAIPGDVDVHDHGFLTHAESVSLVQSADILFLPMHDLPPGRRATIVPGKTYEYLASGRPVLAAVPDGDARDLLTRASGVEVCPPRDVAAMARIIAAAAGRGHVPDVDRRDILEPLQRARLAQRMAGVLDLACGFEAPRATQPPGVVRAVG